MAEFWITHDRDAGEVTFAAEWANGEVIGVLPVCALEAVGITPLLEGRDLIFLPSEAEAVVASLRRVSYLTTWTDGGGMRRDETWRFVP